MAETQSLAAVAKAAKKRQAAKRIAAKRKAAERAGAGAGAEDEHDEVVASASAASSSSSKNKKGKSPTAQTSLKRKRAAAPAGPTKRLRADQLAWKSVNTSSLPGMDGGGGMMMLEELDGVGVEWEEGVDGGRTARFVTEQEEPEVKKAKGQGKGKGKAEIVDEDVDVTDDGDDNEGVEEDVEGDGDDAVEDDLASDDDSASADAPDELSSLTFAGLSAADLNDADDEDAAPKFNEKKLPAWRSIPLDARLKAALQKLGFTSPTDIQRRALPPALEGRDVVGVAETGSGKTLAYALPILSYLLSQPPPAASERRPLTALILCPTRELALQVSEAIGRVLDLACPRKAGRPPRVSVGAVVGGLSAHKQQRVVERGADVLVATPGRLWDLLKMNDTLAAGVRGLRFLVIDEADRMIETGHFAELEHIVGLTQRSGTHDEAVGEEEDPTFAAAGTELTRAAARDDMQTFVFSATLSKDLQTNLKRRGGRRPRPHGKKTSSTLEDLVTRLDFRDDAPDVVDLSPDGGLVATLRESQVECVTADKDLYLYYFLLRYPGRSLVFTGSIDGIRRLIPLFETLKVPVYPLHSQLQQKQRLKNLDRFRNQPNAVLIATDVAARGLDIPAVDHVVHFNLPRSADAYVHRSGRTARAQNPGFALQIVSPEDRGVQRQLMRALGRDKPPPDLPIEAGFLRPLKERIALARDIEKAQHTAKKDAHDKNWLREAAEAMDVDIDPSMLSESDSDADAPYERTGRKSRATAGLKARLASLLATPLLARGVSARYPTSGSRVVVDDVLTGAAHGAMLGAPTAAAYQDADGVVAAQPRPKAKPSPKAKAQPDVKAKSNTKGKGSDERKAGQAKGQARKGRR